MIFGYLNQIVLMFIFCITPSLVAGGKAEALPQQEIVEYKAIPDGTNSDRPDTIPFENDEERENTPDDNAIFQGPVNILSCLLSDLSPVNHVDQSDLITQILLKPPKID